MNLITAIVLMFIPIGAYSYQELGALEMEETQNLSVAGCPGARALVGGYIIYRLACKADESWNKTPHGKRSLEVDLYDWDCECRKCFDLKGLEDYLGRAVNDHEREHYMKIMPELKDIDWYCPTDRKEHRECPNRKK